MITYSPLLCTTPLSLYSGSFHYIITNRALSLIQLHPDINRDDPNTHEKFIQLKEAYSVLSSPKHKRDYDNNQAIRNSMFRARTTSTHSKVSEHGTLR